MANNESSKVKGSSLEKNPALDTYLRRRVKELDAPVRNKKLVLPASRLDKESDSPDWLTKKALGQRHVDNWSGKFDLGVASNPRKSFFASMLRYFGVAIIGGGISGAALIYVILHYYNASRPEPSNVLPYAPAPAAVSTSDGIADRPPRDQPASSGTPYALPKPAAQSEAPLRQAGVPESRSSAGVFSTDVDAKPKEPNAAAKTEAIVPLAEAAPIPAPVSSRQEDKEAKPAEGGRTDTSAPRRDIQPAKLAAEQEQKMLKRASIVMSQNDIAGARLIFQYLANHGSAGGAFALAETYDPKKWADRLVTGMTPDANLARSWYARAAELGSKEAAAVLRKEEP
jgi:hypothetical protein